MNDRITQVAKEGKNIAQKFKKITTLQELSVLLELSTKSISDMQKLSKK